MPTGEEKASSHTISILDVAAAAGVSKSTASRALLGVGDVAEKTRQRVERVAREIGYVKDFNAHALKSGRSRTIAIYVRSVQLSYYGELIAAIQAHLEEAEYRVAIVSATPSDTRPLETLLALRPAAAVIASGRVPLASLRGHRKIPIVLAGSSVTESSLSSVGDDGAGCDVLASRLVDVGHRRVAVPAIPLGRSRTLAPRSDRMRQALLERGVEVVEIATSAPDDAPDEAQLRAALGDVTAIMCPNDPVLVHVWNLLQAWGLNVPGDVSLTGYDGAGQLASPAIGLTTWAQPLADIGRHVADELVRRLKDPDAKPAHISLPGRLIPGRTLGAPRGR